MKSIKILYLILLVFLFSLVKTQPSVTTIEIGYDKEETMDGLFKIYLLKIPDNTPFIKVKTIPINHESPVNFFFGDVI